MSENRGPRYRVWRGWLLVRIPSPLGAGLVFVGRRGGRVWGRRGVLVGGNGRREVCLRSDGKIWDSGCCHTFRCLGDLSMSGRLHVACLVVWCRKRLLRLHFCKSRQCGRELLRRTAFSKRCESRKDECYPRVDVFGAVNHAHAIRNTPLRGCKPCLDSYDFFGEDGRKERLYSQANTFCVSGTIYKERKRMRRN